MDIFCCWTLSLLAMIFAAAVFLLLVVVNALSVQGNVGKLYFLLIDTFFLV